MTPAQRDRFLAAFLEDDRYHLALADHEPDNDTALGINYHRPAAGERRVRDHGRAQRQRLDHQRRQGLRRQRAGRQADRGRGRRPTRASALLLVPADTPGLTVTESPGRAGITAPAAEIVLKDCRVPADNLLPARPACAATPAAACRCAQAAQPRHRPRRLRGRAGLRAASRAGRPPDRRASGDRHQARRHRDPARSGAQRRLAGGLGVGPSGRACRPQPARPAADDRSRRSSPPKRSIAPPRTPPNASAPWA